MKNVKKVVLSVAFTSYKEYTVKRWQMPAIKNNILRPRQMRFTTNTIRVDINNKTMPHG